MAASWLCLPFQWFSRDELTQCVGSQQHGGVVYDSTDPLGIIFQGTQGTHWPCTTCTSISWSAPTAFDMLALGSAFNMGMGQNWSPMGPQILVIFWYMFSINHPIIGVPKCDAYPNRSGQQRILDTNREDTSWGLTGCQLFQASYMRQLSTGWWDKTSNV